MECQPAYYLSGVKVPHYADVKWFGSLVILLICFCGMPHKAIAGTDTIALSGDSAPDANGSFLLLGYPSLNILPSLNVDGRVSFWAMLDSTLGGFSDDSGIFIGDGSPIAQIVREGQAAPDGNGAYAGFSIPVINNADQVAFLSLLSGTSGGNTDNGGVFRGNGASVTRIARLGQAAPDTNGVFSDFEALSLNESGQVASWAAFAATSGGSADNTGVVRGDGITLTQIAREGQSSPDANGTFSHFVSSIDISLNNTGQVAFRGFLNGTSGGGTDNEGIFHGDGITLTKIVRKGQSAPGLNGNFSEFGNPSLNNTGQAAVLAALSGTSGGDSDNEGIYRGDGISLVQIIRKGVAPPDTNGLFSAFGSPVINDAGQVVFISVLSGTSGGEFDSAGVFRGDGGIIARIARAGEAAPDANGSFYGFAGPAAITDGGTVAFWAQIVGTSGGGADDGGIFLGDGIETIQAAREGDALAGSTIVNANFLQGMNSGLNDHGQVAYHALLADERESIFLFTPDLHWRNAGNGFWDIHGNWTLGLSPGVRPHNLLLYLY